MPRLQQDKFKVFVSHKSDDKGLANLVAEKLRDLAPDLIECWVSGQALTAGAEWERQIKKQLGQSHLLVLLFTTPRHTWDWCLYEVGLFLHFDADDDDVVPVACLFDPNGMPPAPLNQVQCVRATPEDIAAQLVRPICTETWSVSDTWQRGALVPDVSEDLIATVAEQIAEAFDHVIAKSASDQTPDVYPYRPCHRIVLDLTTCSRADAKEGVPRNARVVEGIDDTTSYTLSLFRAHDGKSTWTWGDLIDEVGGNGANWLRDLNRSLPQSLERHLWSPSTEVMEVWQPHSDRRRRYRPMIYEIVRRSSDDKPVEVTILLVPEGAPAPDHVFARSDSSTT
jgi:hypothetical protein